jgi:hypothetical protein
MISSFINIQFFDTQKKIGNNKKGGANPSNYLKDVQVFLVYKLFLKYTLNSKLIHNKF